MGFGSYDEAEHEKTDVGSGDSIPESQNVHKGSSANGEVSFELGETDDMLAQLKQMQEDDESDD